MEFTLILYLYGIYSKYGFSLVPILYLKFLFVCLKCLVVREIVGNAVVE